MIDSGTQIELLELLHSLQVTITDDWQKMMVRQIRKVVLGTTDIQHLRKMKRCRNFQDNFEVDYNE